MIQLWPRIEVQWPWLCITYSYSRRQFLKLGLHIGVTWCQVSPLKVVTSLVWGAIWALGLSIALQMIPMSGKAGNCCEPIAIWWLQLPSLWKVLSLVQPMFLLCWLTSGFRTNTFFIFIQAFGESHPASVGRAALSPLSAYIFCAHFFHGAT